MSSQSSHHLQSSISVGEKLALTIAILSVQGWQIQACGCKETKEHWNPVPQLQGVLFVSTVGLGRWAVQVRWVDAGTAESCSDAQIFNACQLKKRIEDGRIGFPDPVPITQGGRDVPYFILADDAFALKTWLMKPYGTRMLTREERIGNYRISRGRRVVENAFAILVSRFRVILTTIELPPATVREVVVTCVVLHNILRSQCLVIVD